jgi:hypothetical protein
MPRNTFILGQHDIKDGTFTDPKLDPASQLYALLNKRVEDTFGIYAKTVSGGSVRLDTELAAETQSAALGITGIVIGPDAPERHNIFEAGTDKAIDGGSSTHVCGVLSFTASQPGYALSCTNAVATIPYIGSSAAIAAGDTLQIYSGPTLIQTVTVLTNVVGTPTSGTLTVSAPFVAATGAYSGIRMPRWTLDFQVAETGGAYSFGAPTSVDISLRKRLQLHEHSGKFLVHTPPLSGTQGEVGGSSAVDIAARTEIDRIRAWIIDAGGLPTGIDNWCVCVHKHLEEIFVTTVPGITHLKLTGVHLQETEYLADPGSVEGTTEYAEINVFRNGMEQKIVEDYTWTFQKDLVTFTPPSVAGEIFVVKAVVKCPDLLSFIPNYFGLGPLPTRQPNHPPLTPTYVGQFVSGVPLLIGSPVVAGTVVDVQAIVSDPDYTGDCISGVQLQAEVVISPPVWTGIPQWQGDHVIPGEVATVSIDTSGFPLGTYNYQIRARDANNASSAFDTPILGAFIVV